jgi:hypothetical protein
MSFYNIFISLNPIFKQCGFLRQIFHRDDYKIGITTLSSVSFAFSRIEAVVVNDSTLWFYQNPNFIAFSVGLKSSIFFEFIDRQANTIPFQIEILRICLALDSKT